MATCENVIVERKEIGCSELASSDLYLDLLKKVLTDSIFRAEPNLETQSETAYIQSFIQHCIKGRALTMVPSARLGNVQRCVEDVIKNDVPGDVIETGVWRGGTAIFIKAILRVHNAENRCVWVADSFEGLPKPDASQFPVEAQAHDSKLMQDVYHHFAVSLDDVQQNFNRFGLLDDGVKFLKGWFKDTLPSAAINQLAVARLDGDYYESTMDSLVNLYHKISPGGYVIVDDYGQDDWTYCRKAVDEFRARHEITEPIVRVDSTCHFWQKRA